MKFLIDMNLSPRWIDVFRAAGMEARHWSAVGPANAADRVLFDYAAENDFVILTHDLDFGAMLAAAGSRKPSVVQLRGLDLRPERAAPTLLSALQQCEEELRTGALVTLDTRRTRLRILPLKHAMR